MACIGQQAASWPSRRSLGVFMALLATSGFVFVLSSYVVDTSSVKPMKGTWWLSAPVQRQADVSRHLASTSFGITDQHLPPRTENSSSRDRSNSSCNDVITAMTQGRWIRHTMTSEETKKMKEFHKQVRETDHGMPPGLQRSDRKCGNLSFLGDSSEAGSKSTAHWFRALCDADGDTPCCYHNQCVGDVSEEQCTCDQCIDMRRPPLQAEYATWRPWEPACGDVSGMMLVNDMCSLLEGATVYVIGDSMVRHIFTALLMAVRNDPVSGAFRKSMPPEIRAECEGIYMFTEKVCREWVDHTATVCPNDAASLKYIGKSFNSEGFSIRNAVNNLSNKPRSLVLIGLGFHDALQPEETFNKVMLPLLKIRRSNQTWPKLVWVNVHHWGLLKSPTSVKQQLPIVQHFNQRMKEQLGPWGVPVLDTFNMTAGVESFDGTHYGYGVNKVKAQILFHFLRELRTKGQW